MPRSLSSRRSRKSPDARRLLLERLENRWVLDGAAMCVAPPPIDLHLDLDSQAGAASPASAAVWFPSPPGFSGPESGEGEGPSGPTGPPTATVSIAPLSANKAETDVNTPFTFRLTLTGAAPGGFDVQWETMDGSAMGSTIDFNDVEGSSVHFTGTDGETHDITVTVWGDDVVEIDETFQVFYEVINVNTTVNLLGTTGSAQGMILNDDSAVVTINDVGVKNESPLQANKGPHVFTVSLSAPVQAYAGNSLVVDYNVENLTTTDADRLENGARSVSFNLPATIRSAPW